MGKTKATKQKEDGLTISTTVKITFTLTDANLKKVQNALKNLEKQGIKLSNPNEVDVNE